MKYLFVSTEFTMNIHTRACSRARTHTHTHTHTHTCPIPFQSCLITRLLFSPFLFFAIFSMFDGFHQIKEDLLIQTRKVKREAHRRETETIYIGLIFDGFVKYQNSCTYVFSLYLKCVSKRLSIIITIVYKYTYT